MSRIVVLCECNSFQCDRTISLSIQEAAKVKYDPKWVVIIDGCPNGPEPTDTLIKQKNGYAIYEEG